MGLFSKIKNGLKKTGTGFMEKVGSVLSSFKKIDEELFEELEETLILCDIGAATSTKICAILREKVKEERVDDPTLIRGMLKDIIFEMLNGDNNLDVSTSPTVIMVIGVNGVGKTTSIGKMAANFKAQGKQVVLGAADTFRAAAIDQLAIWAQRAGVPMVKSVEGTDPASVVFDTMASATAKKADVIICDTAGRLHNKKNLMDELAKMNRVIDTTLGEGKKETLLVLDAATGQNAVNQARQFSEVTDITGIVLTKLDGTAHGGVVITIMDELGIPVKLIGVGEQIDDLMPFDAREFADGLFPDEV
ncbi:MAG: signal recognition particle-docking protein FtsY [Clostridia bacterium]|nr:signal recognition particle-docking protein FtsY [Clostridia bacterium]